MVNTRSSPGTGWLAIAVGAAAIAGLAFIALFSTLGQPRGSLFDACIALGHPQRGSGVGAVRALPRAIALDAC